MVTHFRTVSVNIMRIRGLTGSSPANDPCCTSVPYFCFSLLFFYEAEKIKHLFVDLKLFFGSLINFNVSFSLAASTALRSALPQM